MATEDCNGPTDHTLKDIGLKAKPMAEVSLRQLKVIFWKENGRRTRQLDLVFSNKKTVRVCLKVT